MTTALGIIKSAMRKGGILTKSEEPSADEVSDALDMLNDILSSLSNDSLIVYARELENFNLTSGQSDYTMGTGGDFNTARPIKIISAYVRLGTIDYPLSVITDEQYSSISYKTIGSIPRFYNYTNAYPLSKFKLYPVPSSAGQIFILSEKQLSQFTLNQTVDLPPGWKRMLINLLAIELLPEYGQPVTPELKMIADESKQEIRRAVMAARDMDWENGVSNQNNIYTGWGY